MNRNQNSFIQENNSCHDLFNQLLGDSPDFVAHRLDFDDIQNIYQENHHSFGSTNTDNIDKKTTKKVKTHCTCQKSKCNQKYCPCYKQGNKCNPSCICSQCSNKKFIPKKVSFQFGSLEQFCLPSFSF